MTLPDWLRINDPGGEALRTGARIAVVVAAMIVVSNTIIDNPNFSAFATFGSFGLLSFANFAGPLPVRFVAGLVFGVVGSAVIVVGTLAAGNIIASAVVMFVVAFAMNYGAVLGGHLAAGSKGMVLAAVLALMTPGGVGHIGDRVAGWMLAAVVGSVASVLLWPVRHRRVIRSELAEISRVLAGHLRGAATLQAADMDAVRARITSLREKVDAMLTRPGGPRARDAALLYLLDESGRTTMFLERVVTERDRGSVLSEDDLEMLTRAADVLEGTAATLVEGDSETPTQELLSLRRHEMDRVQAALHGEELRRDGVAPSALLTRFDLLFPLRMLSYLALSMGANALVATGRSPEAAPWEFQAESPVIRNDIRSVWDRFVSILRGNLTPESRWFRNAARAAVALTAAVVVADLVSLDRSFWIVLGALSVVRSSVADTGVTVLESVLGTIGGFLVSALMIVAVGDHRGLLWVLMPFVVFLAGYSSKAISFPVGQGAFTVMTVLMLNLSEPLGWTLGFVRVHRVLIGVGVTIVVAAVMWPRGVSHDLARAVRHEFDAAVTWLRTALRSVLEDRERATAEHALRQALRTRMIADGELGDLMNSRGTKHVPADTWARLVAQPHALVLGGSWMDSVAIGQGRPALDTTDAPPVARVVGALDALVNDLDAPLQDVTHAVASPQFAARLLAARSSLEAALADPSTLTTLSDRQVIALVWTLQWLEFTHDLEATLRAPVEEVRASLARSWWR